MTSKTELPAQPQVMERDAKDSARIGPFVLATAIYVLVVAGLSAWYWRWFLNLRPDAWGNFLAGLFSPLAFLWLVYTAVAQKAELSLQREELSQNNLTQREQQEQLQRQADALNAQAKLFRAQAAATYMPVIALQNDSAIAEDGVELLLMNLGSPVVEIWSKNARLIATSLLGTERTLGRRYAPLWEKGSYLRLVAFVGVDRANAEFSLLVKRLDGVRTVFLLNYNFADRLLTTIDAHQPSHEEFLSYLE